MEDHGAWRRRRPPTLSAVAPPRCPSTSKSSERNTSNKTRTLSTIPPKAQTKLFTAPPPAITASPEASQLSGALSKPSPSSCAIWEHDPIEGRDPDVGGRGDRKAPISILATVGLKRWRSTASREGGGIAGQMQFSRGTTRRRKRSNH